MIDITLSNSCQSLCCLRHLEYSCYFFWILYSLLFDYLFVSSSNAKSSWLLHHCCDIVVGFGLAVLMRCCPSHYYSVTMIWSNSFVGRIGQFGGIGSCLEWRSCHPVIYYPYFRWVLLYPNSFQCSYWLSAYFCDYQMRLRSFSRICFHHFYSSTSLYPVRSPGLCCRPECFEHRLHRGTIVDWCGSGCHQFPPEMSISTNYQYWIWYHQIVL